MSVIGAVHISNSACFHSSITGHGRYPFPTGESYYLSAAYKFVDWFTLGAYYSEYYPDKDEKDGDNINSFNNLPVGNNAWEKDLALTLRFDINEYWIFKVEGHAVDGTANILTVDNLDNDFSEDRWYYGAAKLTFTF